MEVYSISFQCRMYLVHLLHTLSSFSFVQDMNRKYPGAGTQGPSKYAAFAYGFSYYWPNITPLSPIGNPNVSGIIAGQIHDPATP